MQPANKKKQNPAWEANGFSATQDTPSILGSHAGRYEEYGDLSL
jgi:hypothetical protein